MAGMEKTFRLVLDADATAAVNGLDSVGAAAKKTEQQTTASAKNIGTGMEGAAQKTGILDKAAGKLGVSTGQMATIAGGAAVAAGSAIAKFALDGAAKFGELGEKIETFKGIAGVPAEVASRWVAVADDFGVSADELAGGIGKLAKGLGANIDMLDKYGVSVAYAKDGTVDMNATTMNVIDTYNNTVDPAKKAALATAAFGKSYTSLIPLIDEGSTKILDRMKEVDGAQLFNDKKLAEAKVYRLAMDEISDSMQDLQMNVGELLIPAIDKLSKAMDHANPTLQTAVTWIDKFGNAVIGMDEASVQLSPLGLIFGEINKVTPQAKANVDDVTAATLLAGRAAREATEATGGYAAGTIDMADADKQLFLSHVETTASTKDLEKATQGLIKRYQDEQGAILDVKNAMDDSIGSALEAQQATLDQATAVDDYTKSLKDSKLTAGDHKQAFLDVENQILDTSNTLGDYAVNQAKASGAVMTAQDEAKVHTDAQIDSLEKEAATLAPGSPLRTSLEQWIAILKSTPTEINTNFTISGTGGNAGPRVGPGGSTPHFAAGGVVPGAIGAPMFAIVHGGETITPPRGGMSGSSNGGITVNQYINVMPGADQTSAGKAIEELRAAFKRVGGTLVS